MDNTLFFVNALFFERILKFAFFLALVYKNLEKNNEEKGTLITWKIYAEDFLVIKLLIFLIF